jgi:hypothetical protein
MELKCPFLTVHANKPLDVALAMNSERSHRVCEPNNERSLQVAFAYYVCTVRYRRTYT